MKSASDNMGRLLAGFVALLSVSRNIISKKVK